MEIDKQNVFIALEDFDRYVPEYILYQLYLQDVQSLIIEGGAKTLNSFITSNLWDEARIFTGNINLNEGIKAPNIIGKTTGKLSIGNDELLFLENEVNRII